MKNNSMPHFEPQKPRHTIELLYCRLEMMAKEMNAVSEMMRYVGGFNERMIQHAKELEGAANIARTWIEEIKEETAGR